MQKNKPMRYGAIEAGGTKFLCAVGSGPQDISEPLRIETGAPEETLAAVISYFHAQGALDAIGIASFGPAGVDKHSTDWGHILTTPKKGWSGFDLAGMVERVLRVPVGFDTDVNGAALAEHRWGAAQGCKAMSYVTVGTGIGGGFVIDGAVLHGARHPEVGHIFVKRHSADLDFAGVCPFHSDCLEGLASGPAIKARWGASLSQLPTDHIARQIIAFYLGQLVVSLVAFASPQRVVLGGGVMHAPGLLDAVAQEAERLGARYFGGSLRGVVVAPGLGDRAGLLGGLCLAEAAMQAGVGDGSL